MVKINNVTVEIQNGNPITFDGTEEFHFGTFVIQNSTQREPYPDYADIDFTINTINREFTLQSDIVKRQSVGIWEHTVTFVEPVIKLASYYHPDRKFDTRDGSKVKYTFHLNQLIKDVSFGKTPIFTVAATTTALLNVDAVDKEYSGGNFLQSLVEMFRSVDAIPTLTLDNEIGHRLITEQNNLISFSDQIAEVITSDIADYGSSVYTKTKNAVYDLNENVSGVFYPEEGAGITARSSVAKYTDTNAEWQINDGVRKMYRVRIMNLGTLSYGTIVADITDWIYDQESWSNLEEERSFTTMIADFYTNNTLYFTADGRVKNGGVEYESSAVGTRIAMRQLIESYLYDAYGVTTEYIGQNLEDYELEFYYQALRDIDAEVERQYSDKVTKRALVTSNQKDSELELGRHGNMLTQFINRIGNDKFDITLRYKEGDPIPFLDDYTAEGYKVLKCLYNRRNNGYDVTFTMVKNASILNPLTSVNSAVSPFTINGKSILTNFVYNEYVEFSETERTNNSNLTTNGREALLNALLWNSVNNTPIQHAQYTSVDTDTLSDTISLSAEAIPLGTSLMFNAQFRDKKRAGYQLVADGVFSKKLRPVSYTNVTGSVDFCKFTFMHSIVTSPNTHPITATQAAIIDGGSNEVNLNPNEILAHTTMEHLITGRDDFIIGDYLAENNSLVQEITSAPSVQIRFYEPSVKHTVLDKVAKSGEIGIGSYMVDGNYNYIDVFVTTGKSWVMCDTTSGRIYMAFNYIDSDIGPRIYINTLEDNPHQETL